MTVSIFSFTIVSKAWYFRVGNFENQLGRGFADHSALEAHFINLPVDVDHRD